MSTSATLTFTGALLLLGALVTVLLSWKRHRQYRAWAAHGAEVAGRVVRVREYASGSALRREPLIEYCTRDGQVHQAWGQSNRGLGVDAEVRLAYDPSNPDAIIARSDLERQARVLVVLLTVLGLVGAGLLVAGLLAAGLVAVGLTCPNAAGQPLLQKWLEPAAHIRRT